MDEMYVDVKGVWHSLYRVVDKTGDTVDFMLCEKRDKLPAEVFFKKSIGSSGLSGKARLDKSDTN
jgi:putative transposase